MTSGLRRSASSFPASFSRWRSRRRSRCISLKRAAIRCSWKVRAETLDAIQQLTSYSVNRTGSRVRVQLDAENYRAKREQSLERLANKVAGKVVKYRRSVTLEPMNAYERHVIHTALQEVPGVTTYSTGVDPNRRVIVAYDREKK